MYKIKRRGVEILPISILGRKKREMSYYIAGEQSAAVTTVALLHYTL